MRKVKKGLIRSHRLLNRSYIADVCRRREGGWMAWLAVVLTVNFKEIVMHNSEMRTVEW